MRKNIENRRRLSLRAKVEEHQGPLYKAIGLMVDEEKRKKLFRLRRKEGKKSEKRPVVRVNINPEALDYSEEIWQDDFCLLLEIAENIGILDIDTVKHEIGVALLSKRVKEWISRHPEFHDLLVQEFDEDIDLLLHLLHDIGKFSIADITTSNKRTSVNQDSQWHSKLAELRQAHAISPEANLLATAYERICILVEDDKYYEEEAKKRIISRLQAFMASKKNTDISIKEFSDAVFIIVFSEGQHKLMMERRISTAARLKFVLNDLAEMEECLDMRDKYRIRGHPLSAAKRLVQSLVLSGKQISLVTWSNLLANVLRHHNPNALLSGYPATPIIRYFDRHLIKNGHVVANPLEVKVATAAVLTSLLDKVHAIFFDLERKYMKREELAGLILRFTNMDLSIQGFTEESQAIVQKLIKALGEDQTFLADLRDEHDMIIRNLNFNTQEYEGIRFVDMRMVFANHLLVNLLFSPKAVNIILNGLERNGLNLLTKNECTAD